MGRNRVWMLSLAGLVILGSLRSATAQGVILTLPKQDGAWVRFEGTVKQVEFRPDAAEGDITMEWIQQLTVKSVGTETAAFRGKQVPCRWIEIKVVTGKPSESGIEAGPVGERIYKVLVPEERVVGQLADGGKIPFSFLDVIKGFRKTGGQVSPLPAGSLAGISAGRPGDALRGRRSEWQRQRGYLAAGMRGPDQNAEVQGQTFDRKRHRTEHERSRGLAQ